MASAPLSCFDRSTALERLASEQFDVLVIGGGITGAGVLLDAASRGLTAALVERADFASGTSSRSSKLVHGGLRYLQQRELALVHESLVERQRLLRNAPHLVEPLEFLVPVFGGGRVADRTVARTLSIALWLYDLCGGWRIGRRHRKVSAEEIAIHMPTLRRDRLVSGLAYYDARTDDARLTLAVVRTAVLDHGAVAANHTAVVDLLEDATGRVLGARVDAGAPHGTFEVQARAVVNATGIWTDGVQALESGERERSIRPAKGIHLTVPAAKLPCDVAAVLPVPKDHRSIFVVPWGEHTYLGTTDTDYEGPLDEPEVDEADLSYLLAAINAVVTEPITAQDVTGRWAGLRPLLCETPGLHHRRSARTADLSRRHRVTVSAGGLVTITGGKLTTYRKMAEDAVDALAPMLSKAPGRSRTRHLLLRGTDPAPSRHPLRDANPAPPGRSAGVTEHLFRRYGNEAATVLALCDEDAKLAQRVVDGLPYLMAEVVFAVHYEMATELADVLSRRTRALLLDERAALSAAPRVGEVMGRLLGWSEGEAAEQVRRLGELAGAP